MFRQYAAWRVSISRRAPSGYCAVVHPGTALVCGFSVCVAGLCHVVWQVRGVLTCLPRGAVAMGRCGASGCDVSERDVNAPILRSEGLSRHQQDALLPCPTPMSADGDRAGLVGTSAQDSTPYADG